MKGKKRIKLLRSQKLLIQMKGEKIQEAIALTNARQDNFQQTLDMIVVEQGVPKEELDQWRLSEDGQAIEKIEDKDKGGK